MDSRILASHDISASSSAGTQNVDTSAEMKSAPALHPTRKGDTGTITSVNISEKKGTRKHPTANKTISLIHDFGVQDDAHAGHWHRQVSLLAEESIHVAQDRGLDVKEGDFGENITTEGIDLKGMPLGTRVRLGSDAEIEISQIGKVCHRRCAIYYLAGDCIFPHEGIFGWVVKPGVVHAGDTIEVVSVGDGTVHHVVSENPFPEKAAEAVANALEEKAAIAEAKKIAEERHGTTA